MGYRTNTMAPCANCGMEGHAKNNCPRPKGCPKFQELTAEDTTSKEARANRLEMKKSGKGGKGKGEGKGKGGGKGKGKGRKGGGGGGICHDFTQGRCDREDCRFSHDPDAEEEPRRESKGGKGKGKGKGKRSAGICFDFKAGNC